jgi:predicted ribosome quality control (RQC) complex YloA/Tae2 family protein
MPQATLSTIQAETKSYSKPKAKHIFVLQLHDGRYVCGQCNNASKRIAAINSGFCPSIRKSMQVNRIIDVRPITADRTLPSVVNRFCERYGVDNVLAV